MVLPCFFSIPTSTPLSSPYGAITYGTDYVWIKWTKIVGTVETTVLTAQKGVIKLNPSYKKRISVPSHPEDVGDASLTIVKLRASDAGTYRCDVIYGIEDTHSMVDLDVSGKLLHLPLSSWNKSKSRKVGEGQFCKSMIIEKCY